MSANEAASKVKTAILTLIEEMNRAGHSGLKFEFHIDTDAATLQSKLTRFVAYSQLKLDN